MPACLLTVLTMAFCVPVPADSWEPFRFLVGEWEGAGDKASGRFTYAFDLQEKVLVRKHHADVPADKDRPVVKHDDLMVIYRAEAGNKIRAIYFDSEDHVINYTVTWSDDKRTLTFLSDEQPSAPRFRLSHVREKDDSLRIKFEIAPPGKPQEFSTYVEGTARKVKKP